jgi:aspartate beta-hydroxylase
MSSNPIDEAQLRAWVQQAEHAFSTGETGKADSLLARLESMAPRHPLVLNALGQRHIHKGNAQAALEVLNAAVAIDGSNPAFWVNLSAAQSQLGLAEDEMASLEKALSIEPRFLPALLQKGSLLNRLGKPRSAAAAYQIALASIPPRANLPPGLKQAIQLAVNSVRENGEALAAFLQDKLGSSRAAVSDTIRFDHCLDILLGRRRPYLPQPTFMYFPYLPAYGFYPRSEFPWLAELEAAAPRIRAEFERVFAQDRDRLEPYVAFPDGVPLDQWKELNHSRRWSAFYLWREGRSFADHQARCPETVAALAKVPRIEISGHGPTAFFSILDGKSHIPAHNGASNTRLTVHLPLVLPGKCTFRVGADRREWKSGEAWVFDDTVEHEAWNESDAPRAILIFDVWNPYLTEAERALITETTVGVEEFYGGVNPWQTQH